MKKYKIGLAALLCATPLLEGAQMPVKLKVATYNIQSFRGMDFDLTPKRTAAAVKCLQVDMAGFQEVRRNRTDPSDFLADIGSECGGQTFFTKTLIKNDFEYGIGSFSRHPARVVKELALPVRKGQEPRAAQFLEITAGGKKFYFITTHLSYEDDAAELRCQQLEKILTTAKNEGFLPAILTGDLNSRPDEPVIKMLKTQWHLTGDAAKSFPADKPDRRIDYIAVSDAGIFRLISTEVVGETQASDHRPVVAEFELNL